MVQCLIFKIAVWLPNLNFILKVLNKKFGFGILTDFQQFWNDPKHTPVIFYYVFMGSDSILSAGERKTSINPEKDRRGSAAST